MASTTTLRVRIATRDRINSMAAADQISSSELLDRLVTREEEDRALRAMNLAFLNLRRDEEAWTAFKVETAQWDSTSADGERDA
jgi:predicted DNA-binding ribbon-helix-helix protein